ncbi:glycerophosphodiester phosphodiesterase GDPD2 [Brachypodium distachyon]|uniref:glycerophosphodiester phosphodiesterase n=2 Tax=Brachypodium distachyon TaxID=15368 RepID=I1IXA3_BRADI|nr:glycerophosphodiester phosphodiesterase GDPD2 [Brachypodium distachyon]KQJ82390.1 hypothetical protein BRADI_5g08707v3 [Brachypodium distachyon]PNT60970.1 hypothetical protein BRADI_5g08707v3 [Brachypodium distachyon]PNT60971.1 hypothetical protein BRADI_5g08707v3 [Brachypodium distachyon]|eukprot:XP_003579655.1 glycerophosphodiester phosphodiesterase GDPD2 [Brachypodium distachyon]
MAQLKAGPRKGTAAVPDIAAQLDLASACIKGGEAMMMGRPALVVIGHRGKGMNALASPDERLREVKENTVRSFNDAASVSGVAYVEFDVQVTKDGCPIIFHDNFIFTQEQDGEITGKRVTDLRLDEFLSYGPQIKDQGKVGRPLLRKLKDGRILRWDVRCDDVLCTLQEAFEDVDTRVGFNVELKFDDDLVYQEGELTGILQSILKVVSEHARDRPIIFSSFQPDAARLMRKLQDGYPVYFLTNGGTQIYADARRNSLEEAVRLCVACGLQGIVSEARAVFRHPAAIVMVKEAGLSLLTYGQLNNVPEAVYMQHLMGVDGVIVDLVQEITEAVSEFAAAVAPAEPGLEDGSVGMLETVAKRTPNFSQREISFLLRLIPELVQ